MTNYTTSKAASESQEAAYDDAKLGMISQATTEEYLPNAQLAPRQPVAARHRVAILGGGSFGSVMARILGNSVADEAKLTDSGLRLFAPERVSWWVRREDQADEINAKHTNEKYLGRNVSLPTNLIASTDLVACVSDATIVVLAVPHEYLDVLLPAIKPALKPGVQVVSLCKSLRYEPLQGAIVPLTQHISTVLGGVATSVLAGPNIYHEMAKDQFAEATLGYDTANAEAARDLASLFSTPLLSVEAIPDRIGVDLCGALKNCITLSCGFVVGMGRSCCRPRACERRPASPLTPARSADTQRAQCERPSLRVRPHRFESLSVAVGTNVRAVVLRKGQQEIERLARSFFPSIEHSTFASSAGIGDLILSCMVGRGQVARAPTLVLILPWHDGPTEACADPGPGLSRRRTSEPKAGHSSHIWRSPEHGADRVRAVTRPWQRLAAMFVEAGGQRSWEDLEKELLGGMRIPDYHNISSLHAFLDQHHQLESYPILVTTHRIAHAGAPPQSLLDALRQTPTVPSPAVPSPAVQPPIGIPSPALPAAAPVPKTAAASHEKNAAPNVAPNNPQPADFPPGVTATSGSVIIENEVAELGLRGKRAMVVGAAGGIGRAIVTSLLRHGVRVLAADVFKEGLEALVQENRPLLLRSNAGGRPLAEEGSTTGSDSDASGGPYPVGEVKEASGAATGGGDEEQLELLVRRLSPPLAPSPSHVPLRPHLLMYPCALTFSCTPLSFFS